MTTLRYLFVVLAALGIMLVPAVAQDDTTTDEPELEDIYFTITGEVEFVEIDGEEELTVGGVIIAPAGAFTPSLLEDGDIVSITGVLLNDDTIMATTIDLDPELDDEEPDPEATEEPAPEVTAEPEPEVTPEPEPTEEPVAEACVPEFHPVANGIADTFEVDVAVIIDLHCQGHGFGNIARAYLLADATEDEGDSAEDYLNQHLEGGGWGQIMRESGVHPSQLAPGQIMSGRYIAGEDGEGWQPGPPEGAGRPEHAGPPEGAGRPENAGPPDHAGRPENAGPPPGRGGGNGNGRGRGN